MTVTREAPERPAQREAEALFPEARRRRRRIRGTLAVIVLAVVIVALVVASVLRSPSPPSALYGQATSHGAASSTSVVPSRMVVWAWHGSTASIQVISSHSGHVVRTLSPDNGLFRSTPEPSVAPDGTVYYDQSQVAVEQGPAAHPPLEEIYSVPITGGVPKLVSVGHDPAVSPDGRYLAFLRFTDITNTPEGVVVMNRLTGALSTWQYSTTAPDILTISWSPDSQSLVVAADVPVSGHFSIGRLQLQNPNHSLDELPQIKLPECPPPTPWAGPGANREMAWAGFLNGKDGIGICHHVGLTLQQNWTQPVVVDLATGGVVRRLATVPGLVGEGSGGGFQADASGHHLLVIRDGLGAGGLYRWTIGNAKSGAQTHPVFVKNNVGSASWVPSNISSVR